MPTEWSSPANDILLEKLLNKPDVLQGILGSMVQPDGSIDGFELTENMGTPSSILREFDRYTSRRYPLSNGTVAILAINVETQEIAGVYSPSSTDKSEYRDTHLYSAIEDLSTIELEISMFVVHESQAVRASFDINFPAAKSGTSE